MTDKVTKCGRILHRGKCEQKVRSSFINKFGDRITLFGKHGFEWSVGVKRTTNSCFLLITFPERASAKEYFNKLKNEYK